MKNKSFKLLISIMLVITMLFTCAFSVACNGGNDNSGSESSRTDPDPQPQPDPDTAEDRSEYTYQKVLESASDLYVKDILGDGNKALSTALKGYLLGDFYSLVVDNLTNSIEGQLPMGVKLDVMGLSVYRGIDGNWYRPIKTNQKDPVTNEYITKNEKVNGCLNGILNYKLDSGEKLNINFSLYGQKTLAYVLFDYSPSSSADTTAYDRNWMFGLLIKSSPELGGIMNMTLEDLRTLVSDTSTVAEKEAVIEKNFKSVQIGSSALTAISALESSIASGEQNVVTQILVSLLKQIRTNKFVVATASITVEQFFKIKNATTDSERYTVLANVYKGVLLADVFGLDDTMKGYISEIHTMSLNGIFSAMAKGTLNEYVFTNIRGLTIDKVIEAYLREDETALANYKKIYEQYQKFFDLSIKDFVDAYDKLGETITDASQKVILAMYNAVKDVPVCNNMTIEGLVTGIMAGIVPATDTAPASFDVLASLKYFDENFAEDLKTVSITDTVNLSDLVKGVIGSFVKGTEDESYTFSFDALTAYLESAFDAQLDSVAQTIAGMDYPALKAMIQKWITVDGQGNVDYKVICTDVMGIIYNKVLVPNGLTEEAFLQWLDTSFGSVINSDSCIIILTKAVEEITGLQGTELDSAFEEITGKTFTMVTDAISAELAAGTVNATTAIYNFIKTYGKDVLAVAKNNRSALLDDFEQIVKNNTTVDGNGNETINYTGVVCDFYAKYRTELVNYVKKSVSEDINGNKLGDLTFDYDVVEFLFFKALDDNLDALKAGTVTVSQVEQDYMSNALTFYRDYFRLKAEKDAGEVLYTFTDSNGNVFDVTVKEVYDVLVEIVKLKTGEPADVVGAVQQLLGNAKVGTVIELISSLISTSPSYTQALAA